MPDIKTEQNQSIEKNIPKPETVENLDMEIEKAPTQEKAPTADMDLKKRVQEQMQGVSISEMAPQPIANPAQVGPSGQEKEIEEILANDLEKIYLKLPDDKKAEFKKTGEKTAREISSLLSQAKVKIENIISLIKKWLELIPGVNKFFLEQEAKIKADEILKIKTGEL